MLFLMLDPNSEDFTLDSLSALGMDAFAETIGQLSLSATKELAIEESLHAIEEQWRNLNMESIPCSFSFPPLVPVSFL